MSQERVQRRLEAIMFADVVGYSRLTGQDEVGTWRRLRRLLREVVRPEVRSHAGRIVRIKGDGILVEFPSAASRVATGSRRNWSPSLSVRPVAPCSHVPPPTVS